MKYFGCFGTFFTEWTLVVAMRDIVVIKDVGRTREGLWWGVVLKIWGVQRGRRLKF